MQRDPESAVAAGGEPRPQALALLTAFCAHVLPPILRRISLWKGIPLRRRHELLAEATQELCVDCLEHGDAIARLSVRECHARWIRITERWIHRCYVRPARREQPPENGFEDLAAAEEPTPPTAVPAVPRFVYFRNGRCNVRQTAGRARTSAQAVRGKLAALAARLGHGDERRVFWRRRLAEALTGLAADLLLDAGSVYALPEARRAPDPKARRRRVRQLAERFLAQCGGPERRIARRVGRTPLTLAAAPRLVLQHAVALGAERPEPWLWLFEATVLDGDYAAAARALRACRCLTTDARTKSRITLARARLAEVLHGVDAATQLLGRAVRRAPHDGRLRAALQAVTAAGTRAARR